MTLRTLLGTLSEPALDLILPLACAGCGTKTQLQGAFCAACAPSVMEAPSSRKLPSLLTSIRCAVLYGGQVAVAIHRLKYRDASYQAALLGNMMRSILPDKLAMDLAIPVPLHPNRLRSRGYNQAALLARAALCGRLPLKCGLLVRKRDTQTQANLKMGQRWENVRGAFVASSQVSGGRILVVDDVTTTGATASACAEALLDRGSKEVHLLTLARAMP